MIRNLWEETINILKDYFVTWEDVECVRLDYFSVPKDNFEEIARKTNYDPDFGYGSATIRTDLKIISHNWWLERVTRDGWEGWEFKAQPFIPNEFQEIKSLTEWGEDD